MNVKKMYKSLIVALLIINMALPSFASVIPRPLPLPTKCISFNDYSLNAVKLRQSLVSQYILGELDDSLRNDETSLEEECYWGSHLPERVQFGLLKFVEDLPYANTIWFNKKSESEKKDFIKAIKDEYNFPQAYIEIKNQARLIIKTASDTRQHIADLEKRYSELINGTYNPDTSEVITGLANQEDVHVILTLLKTSKDYYQALRDMYYGMAKYYRGLKELEALVVSYENPTTGLNSVTSPSQEVIDLSAPSSVPIVRPLSGLSPINQNTGLTGRSTIRVNEN